MQYGYDKDAATRAEERVGVEEILINIQQSSISAKVGVRLGHWEAGRSSSVPKKRWKTDMNVSVSLVVE